MSDARRRGAAAPGAPGAPDERERFWQGLSAGLLLGSAAVGALVTLLARLRGASTGKR